MKKILFALIIVSLMVLNIPSANASASGCVGTTNKSCMNIVGSQTFVSLLQPGAVSHDSQDRTGVYKVTVDTSTFLTSQNAILPNDGAKHTWSWNSGGNGWLFPDGTVICGGFWWANNWWGDLHQPRCFSIKA